jgi:hypothetical protein
MSIEECYVITTTGMSLLKPVIKSAMQQQNSTKTNSSWEPEHQQVILF